MIQDIYPYIMDNQYKSVIPKDEDRVFICNGDSIVLVNNLEEYTVPTVGRLKQMKPGIEKDFRYAFSIDGQDFFLWIRTMEISGEEFRTIALKDFRAFQPEYLRFAGVTASHLSRWYARNRYCGRCGEKMEHSNKERAMICAECGFIDFPKICPAVIVAVTDGNKILLTKYANRPFTRYALIAGFCEVGETVEETIRRELLEEVGLKVKNFRYFGSQPWGISESLLLGYFVELDGDSEIRLDEEELQEGTWVEREDIPEDIENELSLTYTMMRAFRLGEV